ncbi:MAG: LCP family protein [Eubacterium sp.]|nr:LCP family protein [Eubacterium sp.]
MKRPIDPNLENFDNNELPIDIDENGASDIPFKVEEASPANNPDDYHAYQGHRASAESEVPNGNEMTLKEKEHQQHHHHHHHHHHSSSSHHHHSHSHSSHSHSSHHKSKKKKKKLPTAAKIAIIILLLIFFIIFAVVGTIFYLEYKGKSELTNITTQTDYEEKITYNGHDYVYNDDIVSIAFIGVDKRDLGLDDGRVGTAGQADANIVLTIDTSTGKAKAIAIPRDTMVEVDLYSENNIFLRNEEMQLCLSYAYGNGTNTSATNVTTSLSRILYNVPIGKYFALDLNGIAPINDAIGGVTVQSLYDFKNLNIKKGDTVHLVGDLTEAYVRTRDLDDIEASLNRTARQVQYIKAFTSQIVPAVMNDFSIVSKLYNTATDYSATNISLPEATYLASLLIARNITDFETTTLEGEMKPSDRIDYADIVYAEFYPDEDKLMQTVLDTFYTQIN